MKLKTLVILLLAINFFALVYANDIITCDYSLSPTKLGDCKVLIQNCANCSFVNISRIFYPTSNGTILDLNEGMTKFQDSFNYTFCDNTVLGVYIYQTFGNPDGMSDSASVCYLVNRNGYTLSSAETALYFIPLIIFAVLIFIFISNFIRSVTTFSKSIYFLLMYVIGLLPFSFITYQIANNYLVYETFVINLFYYFFYIILILTFPVFLICLGFMVIGVISESNKKKLMQRGHSEDDAIARSRRR